ncbi:MAG: hypothetical protein HY868_25035 [Chloroflexi bacterium]|nr:hypothetical protein [Chloroflexota bacterium]
MRQLRNHIPISGPARREPADGAESPMRVSLGFEPAWYAQRCGVDFSERWHTDPVYRHDTLVAMKAELHRAFPTIAYWDVNRVDDTWTISGAYGSYFIAQVFGGELEYARDRWPHVIRRPSLSLEALASLQVNDLLNAPMVGELDRQMDVIERAAGKIHGYFSWQGVLNNAFNIYGQHIFTAMVETPELAHQFFALIADVMIALAQRVQARQRASGFAINQLDVSNCVMNMISPVMYREFIFPYDKQIAEQFEYFGVHTCNWNVNPYLSVLGELPKMDYLDMGIVSDLRRVRELFPDTRRAVMYSPVKFHDAPRDEIENDMRRICDDLAPCDIVMADIQYTTSDFRVNELLEICHALEHSS